MMISSHLFFGFYRRAHGDLCVTGTGHGRRTANQRAAGIQTRRCSRGRSRARTRDTCHALRAWRGGLATQRAVALRRHADRRRSLFDLHRDPDFPLARLRARNHRARSRDGAHTALRVHERRAEQYPQSKSAAVLSVLLPQFVRPDDAPVWSQVTELSVVLVLFGLMFDLTLAAGAVRISGWLRRHPKAQTV